MTQKEELQKQISELKKEQQKCKGTQCEVYSRVVGYLRPVQGWNAGKKEEFAMRKEYHITSKTDCCGKK